MGFIVFEGLDGAGKSTQLRMLAEHLKGRGRTVFTYHFPDMQSPRFGAQIARFLRGDFGENDQVDPYLVASLYAGDRFDAKAMLLKKITEYDDVVIDRYVDSNVAYQCAKLISETEKKRLMDWIYDVEYHLFDIPRPDLTLFFDVPVNFVRKKLSETREGDDRTYLEGKKDIHEKNISFQEKVREEYLKLFSIQEKHRIISCNSESGEMKSPEAIFTVLKTLV